MRNPKALLGISVLCLALVLFGIILTRLDEASAQYDPSFKNFSYQGIDNVTENVYSINFGDKNTMFVTGGDEGIFYMSTIPVVINELRSERNGVYLGISNILGGDNIKIGKSDNITVIGGEGLFGNNKVVEDYNDNATFFGGSENSILGGMSSDTPTVLLGGVKNKVEPEHDANTIVGGSSNTIYQGAKNVNILGGTRILIDGDDVVAGGQLINGDVSDSFVFNDGDSDVDLVGSGMFFLGVTNGVGFGTGTKERHQGAISNGAVKLGSIDIQGVECTSENVGVMGLWNGCMVGCTSGSAIMSKWEMLGYGSLCEQICKNSDKCIAQELDTLPNEYESFCITGSVDIANTTMCTGSRLDLYHNVVFEAHLIDSDEECSDELINQCVFRCKDQTHLTGDQTGKMGGDTKCFNDCPLPWSGSQYREHNAMITGYSVTGANCSDGARHRDTCADYKKQLMCVDGRWYEMENGVVTETENTDYIYETCTLNEYVCDTSVDAFNLTREDIVNGKEDFIPSIWAYSVVAGNSNSYLMDFLGGNIVPGHIFDYGDISWTNDNMPQLEGSTQVGIRGTYELCIDYAPEMPGNQAPQNEQVCQEAGNLPGQYHYKFIGCNTGNGYDMAGDGVCRKGCYYGAQSIKHGSGIVLYTGETAICPEMCSAKNFICYDGILYADLSLGTNGKFISGTALDSNIYNCTGCTLTGAVCDSGYYNIDEVTYQSMKDIGIFSSCQSSWVFNNQCATGNRYHLDECKDGYYRSGDLCLGNNYTVTFDSNRGTAVESQTVAGGSMATRPNNPEFPGYDFLGWYLTGSSTQFNFSTPITSDITLYAKWEYALNFSDLEMYFVTDAGATGYYAMMDRNLGATMTGAGQVAPIGSYGYYYQWGNNYGFPNNGNLDVGEQVEDISNNYGPGNYYNSGTFILEGFGHPSAYISNGNLRGGNGDEIDRQGPCPEGYHIPAHNEFVNMVDVYWKNSVNDTGGIQWSLDSLMPFAGNRSNQTADIGMLSYGNYWSSTHYNISNAYDLMFVPYGVDVNYSAIRFGLSLRCFKNSSIPSMTINANGGKKALIIVHDGIITKLGTPTKGNMVLKGWYSDPSFAPSSQVHTGEAAPAHLYAKWGCAEGYVQSGNNCVVVYNCEGTLPHGDNVLMGASTGSTQLSWTYKTEGDLGACEWRCHEGYIQSGNTCEIVPSYECVSNDYMFNTGSVVQIVGILPTSIGDVEKQLFASEDVIPNGQACAYVCNEAEGYHYFPDGGGICAKCEDGTESEVNGQLVCTKIIDVCPNPDEYAYVPETHKCEPYGNCMRIGKVNDEIPVGSNITSYNSARPIGTSLMEWQCYGMVGDHNYDDYDYYCDDNGDCGYRYVSNEVYVQNNPNQCLYTCPSGSQCVYGDTLGCVQVDGCIDGYPENREYALTGANNPYWDSIIIDDLHSRHYVSSVRYYLSSVTYEGDFYDEVERNPGACWFWCPESHLCRLNPYTHQPTNNQNLWQCYETEDDRDANCIEQTSSPSNNYTCTTGGRNVNMSDCTLRGESLCIRQAYGRNREFQTYAVPNGIAGHSSEGCYQGCRANALSGVVDYNGSQVCWRQCSEDQYFDVGKGQGCKSCANPSQKPNPDDVFLGNAMSCVDKCPAGSVWGPDYGHDGGEGCRFSVDAGSCPPDLETRIYDPGDGHLICVRDMSS